jgi:signal transduction histidine kinase
VSEAALQQLSDAQAALIAALDNHDIEAIDAANVALTAAIEQVRSAGSWHDRPSLRDDLVQLLKTAEAARGRINALSDQNRRDLDKLISLAGTPRAVAYGRGGRLS